MKRVKLGLMALTAMASIGSAFAFSPAAKPNLTTYYALKQSGSFIWTTTQPSSACARTALKAICTIQTANQPVDGMVPAGHTQNNTVYQ
jgi:hypothetical protein